MDLATGMQATSAEIATLRNITEAELHRIRKADGQVSVFDVIRAVTGQAPKPCRMIWYRLAEMHPELTTICGPYKFNTRGRGGAQETPATDATGITQVLMLLPGRAAAEFRKSTAKVLVRYIGGDPTLVDEIAANRAAQEQLAVEDPEHPARLFGEAVELQSALIDRERRMKELESQQLRRGTMQELILLKQLAGEYDLPLPTSYRTLARQTIEEALLPAGWRGEEMVNAGDYLERRGHNAFEVSKLQTEFGKALKLAKDRLVSEGHLQDQRGTEFKWYGGAYREVQWYHRRDEAAFLDAVYAKFQERPLYKAICNPVIQKTMQEHVAKALEGTRGYVAKQKKLDAWTAQVL